MASHPASRAGFMYATLRCFLSESPSTSIISSLESGSIHAFSMVRTCGVTCGVTFTFLLKITVKNPSNSNSGSGIPASFMAFLILSMPVPLFSMYPDLFSSMAIIGFLATLLLPKSFSLNGFGRPPGLLISTRSSKTSIITFAPFSK